MKMFLLNFVENIFISYNAMVSLIFLHVVLLMTMFKGLLNICLCRIENYFEIICFV